MLKARGSVLARIGCSRNRLLGSGWGALAVGVDPYVTVRAFAKDAKSPRTEKGREG